MSRTILVLALALALPLTGCIQNMAGLRESLGATEESLDQTSDALGEMEKGLNATSNAMKNTSANQTRPPVARMSVFGANGALVFKSSFAAEDPAEVVLVEEKVNLSLNAGDSETLERGATMASYAWLLNGKAHATGRQANLETGEPGIYAITLTVTDSNGKRDSQTVKLGVAPKPYEVVTELVAGAVTGIDGAGEPADVAWELAAPEKPAKVQSVTVVAAPPVTCDAVLDVLDAEGTSLGSSDGSGHSDLDQTETVTLGEIPFAAYTIRIAPFACVADAVPITVTVVLLPIIEGLGTDGHGHAH